MKISGIVSRIFPHIGYKEKMCLKTSIKNVGVTTIAMSAVIGGMNIIEESTLKEEKNKLTELVGSQKAAKIEHYADSTISKSFIYRLAKPLNESTILQDTITELKKQASIDSIKNVGVKEYLQKIRLPR